MHGNYYIACAGELWNFTDDFVVIYCDRERTQLEKPDSSIRRLKKRRDEGSNEV